MHVLFIFIDGLGIGKYDEVSNPCTAPGLVFFNRFLNKHKNQPLPLDGIELGLDATLNTPGLPQSATGQTALLTGINAAQVLGRHLNGFPNEKLRKIIAKNSLLSYLVKIGLKVSFINAFRPPFFDYDPFQIIRYLSVTSVTNLYAQLPFFNLEDLRARHCIYQEFTNAHLRRRGFDVPLFTPQEAGRILAHQSTKFDFCLYEYFQTDRAGHSRDLHIAVKELQKLESFLNSLLTAVNLTDTLVICTSDHGNIEDISVKGHTCNPAMTLIWGRDNEAFAAHLNSILDITPAIKTLFSINTFK